MTARPLEAALGKAVRWLLPALVASPLLLLTPSPGGSTGWVMLHLGLVVVYGLVLTMKLGGLLAGPWFAHLGPLGRSVAAAGSLVALTTGAVALVTLASSAALRLDPSLQFLQLLSAVDIAWASGAAALGWQMRAGRVAAWGAGSTVLIVCLWSVWRYLDVVGFTAQGGWLVDGPAMWTYILPYDMAAAVVATTSLLVGARHRARQRERNPDQARPEPRGSMMTRPRSGA